MKAAKRKRARIEQEAQSSADEKEPKLKCHEMRLIFQRLPTSELIRFISRPPKHPLGRFWSQELKFVVEKRLPFLIKGTATFLDDAPSFSHVIYDCNGSRVAEIKRPEQFHLSPVCELIERAEVSAIVLRASSLPPRFVFPTSDILSTLANLDTLILSAHHVNRRYMRRPLDLHTALAPQVMSRIISVTLSDDDSGARFEKSVAEILSRATGLKELSIRVAYADWQTLLAAVSHPTRGCPGLESLRIANFDYGLWLQPLFKFITTRFSGLRELFLPVRASIQHYLALFQALPGLATLGLAVSQHGVLGLEENEKELSVGDNDPPINSVSELFVAWSSLSGKEPSALLAMLLMFPNVRTFAAEFSGNETTAGRQHGEFLLQFASAVCENGVFPHLQTLKLFSCNVSTSISSDTLLEFIRANIDHLPSSVDLSQVVTAKPLKVDRDFLVDLCLPLRGGRITSLALKDLVHREAVSRLREQLALENQVARGGKVLEWTDEDSIDGRRIRSNAVWWPLAVSDHTNCRIEACKTSGPLKGSAFSVRISDWTEKRKRLFDDSPV